MSDDSVHESHEHLYVIYRAYSSYMTNQTNLNRLRPSKVIVIYSTTHDININGDYDEDPCFFIWSQTSKFVCNFSIWYLTVLSLLRSAYFHVLHRKSKTESRALMPLSHCQPKCLIIIDPCSSYQVHPLKMFTYIYIALQLMLLINIWIWPACFKVRDYLAMWMHSMPVGCSSIRPCLFYFPA